MQRLEVSGAVRPIYGSLGVKRLMSVEICKIGKIGTTGDILDMCWRIYVLWCAQRRKIISHTWLQNLTRDLTFTLMMKGEFQTRSYFTSSAKITLGRRFAWLPEIAQQNLLQDHFSLSCLLCVCAPSGKLKATFLLHRLGGIRWEGVAKLLP